MGVAILGPFFGEGWCRGDQIRPATRTDKGLGLYEIQVGGRSVAENFAWAEKKLSKGVDMRAKRCYNVFMGHSSDYTYP